MDVVMTIPSLDHLEKLTLHYVKNDAFFDMIKNLKGLSALEFGYVELGMDCSLPVAKVHKF